MKKITALITLSVFVMFGVSALNAEETLTYAPDGYAIETIDLPPATRMHIAGLDTNKDGDVYVATRLGEVWRYKNSAWTKFATGLHEPTGLLCDNDGSILVAQKPELTRLIDIDNDGIAEQYIHINSGWEFHDNYHEFNFGPVKDKKGNLYGTLNLGHNMNRPGMLNLGGMKSAGGYRGWAYKVDKKGQFTPFASGLRSPAGLGMSPKGELFYTDNQGDWVGTSKMHLLSQGKFYGHPSSLVDHPDFTDEQLISMNADDFAKFAEQPVVWIPQVEIANSPGNPAWDTSRGKFGPFKKQIFIGDQTQSNIFRVLLEKVNGQYQGAVINFMNGFQSGNIRTSFDKQGQLWVGQTARGWSAKGGKPFGLQKVVWDGTQPFELLDIKLTKKGFKLCFTEAIDAASIDASKLMVKQWHYKYSRDYGSPKIDLKTLDVRSAKLSRSRKVLNIELDLTAGKVLMIDFSNLTSKTKRSPSSTKVYYTLNNLK